LTATGAVPSEPRDQSTARLRIEIREVKISLLKWLVPIIIGQGAFEVALLKIIK
jgi:hypothetical protein